MSEDINKTIFSKIISIFWEPSATFRALAVKTGWLDIVVPVLLVLLVALAGMPYVTPLTVEEQKDYIARSERLTEEQKALAYDRIDQQAGSARAYITSAVFIVVRTAVVAGVLILVSNFLFGGEVKYKSMLAVSAYASLVDIIANAVKVPLMLSQQTVRIYTSPAVFLQDDSTFWFRLFANLDLFVLWKVILLGIGVGVVSKVKTSKSIWTIFICWLIYCLAVAGIGGLAKI
ncbi:MAG TPA: YIP1 family protein [Candidatus Marinimicrobia bacterium]|nr:YIP1 family protein [Candidatus Neomarinimicrobiota bacterium]HRS51795.1 YIP1 family protein [Candidatus Neomarinimicrobiota bacterium]HRU92653.1 YIP1 family protein [Candidatus Neomarinimicrobiota bacterium]